MEEIVNPHSLLRTMMTDPIFKKNPNDEEFHIPYLMLLGVLYCASNTAVKAEKFYELCQLDLHVQMNRNDKEYIDYFPKLLQISYEFIIKTYITFRVWEIDTFECEIEDFILSNEVMQRVYEEEVMEMTEQLFLKNAEIGKEVFIKRFENRFAKFLMAHELRKMVSRNVKRDISRY